MLTSSINKEEFNHVDDLDVTKDIWTILWMAHEGSKPVRKAKVEMFEGQLDRFIMYDDEITYEMFNRLEASQQSKSSRVQEVDRSHIDRKIDDGLHSNKL
jgi:hypothetical protein